MRIAINAWFADQPTTGSGQYLTHLLQAYAAGPALDRYLLLVPSTRPVPIPLTALGPSFEWQRLWTPFDGLHSHLAKLWFEQVSLPRACRRWGATLVHVPYWAAPLRSPAPVVVTVHDLIPLLLPAYRGGPLGQLYTILVTRSARRATAVLTDSYASRADIVRHLGIPASRVRAVHLAAEDRFRPSADPTAAEHVRSRLGLPPRYLLYLGGFDVRKNVTRILHAFAQLDAAEVQLVVAGRLPEHDTPFAPDPRRTVHELGLVGRVCFTGWVDEADKPALYREAEALLFPSLYEGFGLPPLEALSCGTPAIVSDRSSLPEVVNGGGLCVDPEDTGALTAAMERLLRDAPYRTQLRRAGLEHAAKFCWAKTAQQTLDAYHAVMDG
ncbi:MAG TPA: glycosyltransferase family 1 protein [Anaerolineae bacterium]|nr:glycosyltransferase family 1 protein [Anaerolineae bacterium]